MVRSFVRGLGLGVWLATALPANAAAPDAAGASLPTGTALVAPDAPASEAPSADLGAPADRNETIAVRPSVDPAPTAPTEPVPAPVAAVPAPAPVAALPARDDDKPQTAPVAGAAIVLPPPPDAAVTITVSDVLAAEIGRRLADPKLPLPPRLSRKDRDALAAAYVARAGAPIWIDDHGWTPAAAPVIERLGRADEDGLDPADYPVPILSSGKTALPELIEAELKLSAAAYLYARDARGGRLDPSRVAALITPKLELPTVAEILSALSAAPDAGAALLAYNPAYPGYRALRDKLAEIRRSRPAGVPMVRGIRSAPNVRQASADFGDGDRGVPRMPAVSGRLEGDLVANMERWRWLPSAVPNRMINVNVPEFRLRLIEDGRVVHETRVVTGKADTPTPIFSGIMEYAIVNPSWFIPPSILKKEILPGLAKDPNYAAKRGYEVVRRGNSVTVRQPPGERNALGYIKFMFPNDHAVYLHDTPSRSLFGASQRAFSHGCVRVENPFELGGEILGHGWTEGRLKSLIGRGERTIFLAEKLPVNLTYFTVAVDEWGSVRTFDDVYGYNRRVRQALGLGA